MYEGHSGGNTFQSACKKRHFSDLRSSLNQLRVLSVSSFYMSDLRSDFKEVINSSRRRSLFGGGIIDVSDSHREDAATNTSSVPKKDQRRAVSGDSVKTVVVPPASQSFLNRLEKARYEAMRVVTKPEGQPIGGTFCFEVLPSQILQS